MEQGVRSTPASATHGSSAGRAIDPAPTSAGTAADSVRAASQTARIAVVIITWNRRDDVLQVLDALTKQRYPTNLMDLIIVDNASDDGTLQEIQARWSPERIVQNPTLRAHEPAFEIPEPGDANTGGFGSLTVVRNTANHGGCGGFNTGFAYAEQLAESPDFLWLVDDDIDLVPDTLLQLTRAIATDDTIGLVGSRTVDINNRDRTIETTIYFNREDGSMSDHPPAHHRLHDSHAAWIKEVGDTRGTTQYSGLRDVDVVSACCMLARCSAVREVGFWDWRYFIYCDDADWSLRFGKAGYRVVLNLDAVVFHTPWNMKLTPARIYYAQRNAVWMLQKVLEGAELRRATDTYLWRIVRFAQHAAMHRRLTHAEIIRTTAHDVVIGQTGKSAPSTPPAIELVEALRESGLLRSNRRIAILGMMPESATLAEAFRDRVRAGLRDGEQEPAWVHIMRNDVVDPPAGSIIYGGRIQSRLRRQISAFFARPHAAVVFDQINDFPLLFGRWTVHVDQRSPEKALVERDGIVPKLRFLRRWVPTWCATKRYAREVVPHRSESRYG